MMDGYKDKKVAEKKILIIWFTNVSMSAETKFIILEKDQLHCGFEVVT